MKVLLVDKARFLLLCVDGPFLVPHALICHLDCEGDGVYHKRGRLVIVRALVRGAHVDLPDDLLRGPITAHLGHNAPLPILNLHLDLHEIQRLAPRPLPLLTMGAGRRTHPTLIDTGSFLRLWVAAVVRLLDQVGALVDHHVDGP